MQQARQPMIRPPVVILRDGTDASQGKGQLLSNIQACQSIVQIMATTLGPKGMDKLVVDGQGRATISNDGATIIGLLDIVHPAARALVDISRAQDEEVGDGTTSVVLLAGELLKCCRPFVEDNVAPSLLISAFREACSVALKYLPKLTIKKSGEDRLSRESLIACARTSMSSKLIKANQGFFSEMVVDAICMLEGLPSPASAEAGCEDQREIDLSMIGIKKVPGGSIEDCRLVDGIAFEKTFSYAGHEQQPKQFNNPAILLLNIELELRAERDNAEVRIENVSDYGKIVDAEWNILWGRLEKIVASGANVVLSQLAIGDVATQYFADRGVFAAGRVPRDDMRRMQVATNAVIHTTLSYDKEVAKEEGDNGNNTDPASKQKHQRLGTCARFEERQLGDKRFNFFLGCPGTRTCSLILRGGSAQFIAEVERSLHDSLMIVKRCVQSRVIVAGGGAVEMAIAQHLRSHARSIAGKQQLMMFAFAQALECIPRQLADNAGLDAHALLAALRRAHSNPTTSATNQSSDDNANGGIWTGIDIDGECTGNMATKSVWEPMIIKKNMLSAACEAACTVLSVDLSIKAATSKNDQMMQSALPGQPAMH